MRSETNILNTKSYYRDLGSLNTTFINTLITQPDYPSEVQLIFKNTESFLKKALWNLFGSASTLLASFL